MHIHFRILYILKQSYSNHSPQGPTIVGFPPVSQSESVIIKITTKENWKQDVDLE